MRKRQLYWAGVLIALALLMMAMTGCAFSHSPSNNLKDHTPTVPSSLIPVDHALTAIAVGGILVLIAAVVLFFVLPQFNKSIPLAITGAASYTIATVLKVGLPYIFYVSIGLGILALVFGAYEAYEYITTGSFDRPGDGKGYL